MQHITKREWPRTSCKIHCYPSPLARAHADSLLDPASAEAVATTAGPCTPTYDLPSPACNVEQLATMENKLLQSVHCVVALTADGWGGSGAGEAYVGSWSILNTRSISRHRLSNMGSCIINQC